MVGKLSQQTYAQTRTQRLISTQQEQEQKRQISLYQQAEQIKEQQFSNIKSYAEYKQKYEALPPSIKQFFSPPEKLESQLKQVESEYQKYEEQKAEEGYREEAYRKAYEHATIGGALSGTYPYHFRKWYDIYRSEFERQQAAFAPSSVSAPSVSAPKTYTAYKNILTGEMISSAKSPGSLWQPTLVTTQGVPIIPYSQGYLPSISDIPSVVSKAPTQKEAYLEYIKDRNPVTATLEFIGEKARGRIYQMELKQAQKGYGVGQFVGETPLISKTIETAPFIIPQTAPIVLTAAGIGQFTKGGRKEAELFGLQIEEKTKIPAKVGEYGALTLAGVSVFIGGGQTLKQFEKTLGYPKFDTLFGAKTSQIYQRGDIAVSRIETKALTEKKGIFGKSIISSDIKSLAVVGETPLKQVKKFGVVSYIKAKNLKGVIFPTGKKVISPAEKFLGADIGIAIKEPSKELFFGKVPKIRYTTISAGKVRKIEGLREFGEPISSISLGKAVQLKKLIFSISKSAQVESRFFKSGFKILRTGKEKTRGITRIFDYEKQIIRVFNKNLQKSIPKYSGISAIQEQAIKQDISAYFKTQTKTPKISAKIQIPKILAETEIYKIKPAYAMQLKEESLLRVSPASVTALLKKTNQQEKFILRENTLLREEAKSQQKLKYGIKTKIALKQLTQQKFKSAIPKAKFSVKVPKIILSFENLSFLFPKKKGLKLKRMRQKGLTKIFYQAPGFTEKVVGMKQIKISDAAIKNLLKREMTGFELIPSIRRKK